MTTPRPLTKCQRCGWAYAEHGHGIDDFSEECPDDSGRTFKARVSRRAGMSVNAAEVEWLHAVLQALMRGKDCRVLAKRPEVAKWYTKATRARKSIDGAKKGKTT